MGTEEKMEKEVRLHEAEVMWRREQISVVDKGSDNNDGKWIRIEYLEGRIDELKKVLRDGEAFRKWEKKVGRRQ